MSKNYTYELLEITRPIVAPYEFIVYTMELLEITRPTVAPYEIIVYTMENNLHRATTALNDLKSGSPTRHYYWGRAGSIISEGVAVFRYYSKPAAHNEWGEISP